MHVEILSGHGLAKRMGMVAYKKKITWCPALGEFSSRILYSANTPKVNEYEGRQTKSSQAVGGAPELAWDEAKEEAEWASRS